MSYFLRLRSKKRGLKTSSVLLEATNPTLGKWRLMSTHVGSRGRGSSEALRPGEEALLSLKHQSTLFKKKSIKTDPSAQLWQRLLINAQHPLSYFLVMEQSFSWAHCPPATRLHLPPSLAGGYCHAIKFKKVLDGASVKYPEEGGVTPFLATFFILLAGKHVCQLALQPLLWAMRTRATV